MKKILFCFICSFAIFNSYSQNLFIKGKVLNAIDSSALPFVNIYLKNKNIGTSSDNYGNFILKNFALNDTIVFSMIGFKMKKFLAADLYIKKNLIVFLQPTEFQLQEIKITGENPAITLIKDCLKNKQLQNDKIKTLKYSVYSKLTISADTITAGRKSKYSDTVIVAILETFSKAYYKRPDLNSFDIIKRTQSANLSPQSNFLAFGLNLNLYDDVINLLGEKIFTPFHPASIDFYNFKIASTYYDDETLIIKLKIEPKSSFRKLLEGYIYFDARTALPLLVELKPNLAVRLPFSSELHLKQSFLHFEDRLVFPNKLELNAYLKFSPLWLYDGNAKLSISYYASDYEINPSLDENIFYRKRTEVALNANIDDYKNMENYRPIPLSSIEENSYNEIKQAKENPDSLLSVNIFDKYIGGVARQIAKLDQPPFTGIEDFVRHNRIQSFYLGFGYTFETSKYFSLKTKYGYSIADKKISYEISPKINLDSNALSFFDFSYYDQLKRIDNPYIVTDRSNSIFSFMFKNDYGDYYYAKGYEIGVGMESGQLRFIRRNNFQRPNKTRLFYRNEKQTTAKINAAYSLFGKNKTYRDNPAINDGNMKSIGAQIFYKFSPLRKLYDDGFGLTIEYSSPKYLKSDFLFSRIEFFARTKINTFYFWTLNLAASAGIITGKPPIQKIFSLESSQNNIAQAGTFRTLLIKEFYGDRYFAFNFEHNFGEVIPGVLRIPNIAEFGLELISVSNVGWTKFNDKNLNQIFQSVDKTKDKLFWEVGFGINRILIFFRVDFTFRILNRTNNLFVFTISSATF